MRSSRGLIDPLAGASVPVNPATGRAKRVRETDTASEMKTLQRAFKSSANSVDANRTKQQLPSEPKNPAELQKALAAINANEDESDDKKAKRTLELLQRYESRLRTSGHDEDEQYLFEDRDAVIALAMKRYIDEQLEGVGVADGFESVCLRRSGYKAGEPLPTPLGWSNPAYLLDPYLWPVLWQRQDITSKDLRSKFDDEQTGGKFAEHLRRQLDEFMSPSGSDSSAPISEAAVEAQKRVIEMHLTMVANWDLLAEACTTEEFFNRHQRLILSVKQDVRVLYGDLVRRLRSEEEGDYLLSITSTWLERAPAFIAPHIGDLNRRPFARYAKGRSDDQHRSGRGGSGGGKSKKKKNAVGVTFDGAKHELRKDATGVEYIHDRASGRRLGRKRP